MISADQSSVPRKSPVRRKTKSVKDLQKEALTRLQGLRTLSKEISRAYLANLERGILELSDLVNSGVGDGDRKGLKPQVLERMIDVLNDLHVKPEKGKRKGLKKIEEAVKTMSIMVSKG